MRVFVTGALPGPALSRSRRDRNGAVWPRRPPAAQQDLAANAKSAGALPTMLTGRIDTRLLVACPQLTAVSSREPDTRTSMLPPQPPGKRIRVMARRHD